MTVRLKEIKYLLKCIFPFLRSGVETKRGVEFCHLTRNASRIRSKVGNEVSYTRFPLPIRVREADMIYRAIAFLDNKWTIPHKNVTRFDKVFITFRWYY